MNRRTISSSSGVISSVWLLIAFCKIFLSSIVPLLVPSPPPGRGIVLTSFLELPFVYILGTVLSNKSGITSSPCRLDMGSPPFSLPAPFPGTRRIPPESHCQPPGSVRSAARSFLLCSCRCPPKKYFCFRVAYIGILWYYLVVVCNGQLSFGLRIRW